MNKKKGMELLVLAVSESADQIQRCERELYILLPLPAVGRKMRLFTLNTTIFHETKQKRN